MPKAIYTPGAKQDLTQITQYIARDNLSAAMEWLGKTRITCELLAAQSGIGQLVKTKRFSDARRHVAGNYLVYYRPISDGVEILMVVHGARDQDKLL
jgi:toxin ParE1/3/4